MGGKTTKLFKSSAAQPNAKPPDVNDDSGCGERSSNHRERHLPDETFVNRSASPFVRYRKGSMYVDEDGDIAHEFYVETKEGTNLTLKQISNTNLRPQGDVLLDVPCLKNDYPVIMIDQRMIMPKTQPR